MTALELRGKRLVLRSPYEMRELVAAFPGALYDKGFGAWHMPATLGTLAVVHNALNAHGGYESDPAVDAMLERLRAAVAAREMRAAEELPDVPSGSAHEAWLHQRQAYWWALEQEGFILEMVMGSGKSRVFVDLCNAWQAERVLIVCPRNVMRVWPREFRKHSTREFRVTDGRPFKRNGEVKQTASLAERVEQLEWFANEGATMMPLVVVVNYESAWREPMKSWLLAQQWNVGALDESHRAKKPGGKASKFLAHLRDRCDRRAALTGTLIAHNPLDVYAQCRFVEPGLFGTSYATFKARYGKPRVKYMTRDVDAAGELVETPVYLTTPNGDLIIDDVKDEMRGELADKLASVTFSCGDDVLNLPQPVDSVLPVELSAKAQRIYGELDAQLVAEVADAETDEQGNVVVSNVLSKLLRLQQVTSGNVPVEFGDEERVERIDEAKEDALAEWLVDAPREPVIVFCRFKPDLDAVQRVADASGRKYAELSGRRRDALNDDAELAEGVELAGVQIQAGGVGIDFTRARYAVYYSVGFNLVDYTQSRYRVRRPGADLVRPVEFVHLVAERTVDEYVYEVLERRENVAEGVLKMMRERVAA